MGIIRREIKGILISKLQAIGTKSQGPSYFLQPIDDYADRWNEILIRKKTHLWQVDPELDKFVGKKVIIFGEIIETKKTITVDYEFITEVKE